MNLQHLLARHHGILAAAQLRTIGCTPAELRTLLHRGALIRIRHGWYHSNAQVDATALRAVAAGGALTCVPALRLLGLWTPPTPAVHCRRSAAVTTPLPPGLVDCRPTGRRPPVRQAVDDLAMSLRCAANCLPEEEFVILLDSAVNQHRATPEELRQLFATDRAPVRRAVAKLGRAESGTETLTRLRLRARRIKLRSQVWIAGIGRVDFLVGERLVIEVDSIEHHSRGAGYERDRARDQRLVAMGYLVIRISYHQVMERWAEPAAAILAVVRRGDHYWPPRLKRS